MRTLGMIVATLGVAGAIAISTAAPAAAWYGYRHHYYHHHYYHHHYYGYRHRYAQYRGNSCFSCS
jgi:hypothetical protein